LRTSSVQTAGPHLASDITAAAINFDAGANAFTIDTNLNTLTIQGNGIANSSGKTQTIINNAGVLSSTGFGEVSFNNASTAGSATIINNGSPASDASGGETDFNGTSTAGSATIINNGGANVINNGAAFSGDVGSTQFFDTSTAGNATITNNGGTAGGEIGGVTLFQDSSTAGSATIVNNGGTVSGSTIGASFTIFTGTSTAGSAKITNNGGTTLGAVGGITSFSTSSTAGSATIVTNGGTGGGFGGITEFGDDADGGTARAITNGNGTFDISGLTTPGMGIGSIEGSGNYFLGSKTLTKGLDSAVGDPRAAGLFAFINTQPVSSLPQILNLISPEQISSFQATGAAHGNVQIANLGGRMTNIHAGSTGFSSTGLTLTGNAASLGEGFAGVSGSEGKGGPSVFAPTPENRWGVFVTGIGEFTNVDGTPNAAGYNLDTGGMTLGVDYRVCSFLAIGLTAGYAHTNVDIDAGGGNIDVNSGKFGLYATAFGRGFYLDTAVSGGPSGYTTHRKALEGTATGSTGGGDFNALVAVGYDLKIGGLSKRPDFRDTFHSSCCCQGFRIKDARKTMVQPFLTLEFLACRF
jgi:Autotransporter beta-domain